MKRQFGRYIRNNANRPLLRRIARACETYLRYFYNERHWDQNFNGEKWLYERWLKIHAAQAGAGRFVIADVGANSGEWSAMVLAALGEPLKDRYRVIAFEPNPAPFAALERQADGWRKQRYAISVENVGISSADGSAVLGVPLGDDTTGSLAPRSSLEDVRQVDIRLIGAASFQALLNGERLALLKIDTEGHEASIIEALAACIGQHRPTIQFEYGKTFIPARRTLGEIVEVLAPLGYRIGRIHPGWIADFTYHLDEHETYRYGNYVAVPNELAAFFLG